MRKKTMTKVEELTMEEFMTKIIDGNLKRDTEEKQLEKEEETSEELSGNNQNDIAVLQES